MLQRSQLSQTEWDGIVQRLDEPIAAGLAAAVATRGLVTADLAAGFEELGKFWQRGGGTPVYDRVGVGPAYLARYTGRTAANVSLSLGSMLPRVGARILDIGSGVDAVALALAAVAPGRGFELTTSEPSREMRQTADFVPIRETDVRRTRLSLSLAELISNSGVSTGGSFDLIVSSASLPASLAGALTAGSLRAVGRWFRNMLHPGGAVLFITVGAQSGVLANTARAMELGGLQTAVIPQRDLVPRGVALARRLDATTRYLSERAAAIARDPQLTSAGADLLLDSSNGRPWPVLSWSPNVITTYVVASLSGGSRWAREGRRQRASAGGHAA